MAEMKFAVVSNESVKLLADCGGFNDLTDDLVAMLSEDISYRLREMVTKSASYMRKSKRRCLHTHDFNHALRASDVRPIFGHNLPEHASFRLTSNGELHFVEDNEVNFLNIVGNTCVPKPLCKTGVKAQWIAVEGVNKVISSHNSSSRIFNLLVTKDHMNYFYKITEALVGACPALVRFALNDISSNVGVVPVLPYLVNFVCQGVNSLRHNVSKLIVMMNIVKSFAKNDSLFLETQPYLHILVECTKTCLLEPNTAMEKNISRDCWILRQHAAHALSQVILRWHNSQNNLKTKVHKDLIEILQDLSRPLCSHYGAILCLDALGSTDVKNVLIPQLYLLLPYLHTVINDPNPCHSHLDAVNVLGVVLSAVIKMMHSYMYELNHICKGNEYEAAFSDIQGESNHTFADSQDIKTIYQNLYNFFGDALSVQLPLVDIKPR